MENNKLDEYLRRYCEKHEISREEAEQHVIVKEYAKYLKDAEKDKISVAEINAGCGGAELGGNCK